MAGADAGPAAPRPVRLPALLRLAGARHLTEDEYDALHRPRADDVADVRWTPTDVALLDDARDVLGPRHGKGGKIDEADEIRTYGHIVIDEVQDLTPMQLRMAARRSLNGSHDRRRRPRPGHRCRSPPTPGTTCSPTCPTGSRRGSSA